MADLRGLPQPEFNSLADRKIVVLHSGGLDSTTLLYAAKQAGASVYAVSFFYGQRHRRELEAAKSICREIDVPWQLFDLEKAFMPIAAVSKSSLISSAPVPDGHYAEANMVQTIVPNRNMIMASVAVGFAQALGFEMVVVAAHAGDHFIYPDCRPEFLEMLKRAASLATEAEVTVESPFRYLTKSGIVRVGHRLGVPFEKTYSCYKGEELPCGTCGTCTERIESFREAGVTDPTVYQNREEGIRILAQWEELQED